MSTIGSPIETSLLQAAQAQQTASKARDKERAATESRKRFEDMVDLRVAGVESDNAVRNLPENDSEQAETEHQAQDQTLIKHRDGEDDDQPRVDVTA